MHCLLMEYFGVFKYFVSGRIKQSPSTKGALVSSTVTNEQDFDISVRITKSAGISNKLT